MHVTYLEHHRKYSRPTPPLEEQKRIVAVLDQAFAALDRARAHAEANLTDVGKSYLRAVSTVVARMSKGRQERLRLGSIVTRLTNGYVGATRNIYVDSVCHTFCTSRAR